MSWWQRCEDAELQEREGEEAKRQKEDEENKEMMSDT